MQTHPTTEEIKALLEANRTQEAIEILDRLIAGEPDNDTYYYLRGNAYRKHNNWKNAMSDYCKAKELNPQSPAASAYEAAVDIMNFYHRDLYNP